MTVLPIAAFLAGALLTLLLPVTLLIGLTVWYWLYIARRHGSTDPSDTVTPPRAASDGSGERDPATPPSQ